MVGVVADILLLKLSQDPVATLFLTRTLRIVVVGSSGKIVRIEMILALPSVACWPFVDSYGVIPADGRKTSLHHPITLCRGDPVACRDTRAI